MPYYRVRGRQKALSRLGREVIRPIEKDWIEAGSPEEALEIVGDSLGLDYDPDTGEWFGDEYLDDVYLEAEEISQDRILRRMGYSTLPGLE